MSDLDLNYTAGFVDGEGYVTVSVKRSHTARGTLSYTFNPSVTVTNTNKDILDWFKETFRLGKVKPKPRPKSSGWQLCHHWVLQVDEVKTFLEIITPFLRVKQEQAKLTLLFYQIKGVAGDKDVTLDDLKKRFEIAFRINSLNQRGI